ncbi:unnamed protein product [Symbiodinium microadriaticum]|nr:unnamed protein product [Symbiodinium microadriaticum]CAE7945777.1 unnamed protein product [Symbiodinium sp. KB8]
MDFRQVDAKFRKHAVVLQALLYGLLLLFLVYRLSQIWTEHPPVEVTEEIWDGVGKWALCGHPHEGKVLYAAGMGLLKGYYVGHDYFSSTDFATASWALTSKMVDFGIWKLNCSIVDLTSWTPPQVPGTFILCFDVEIAYPLLESNGNWRMIEALVPDEVKAIELQKRKFGWDYGYTSELNESFTFVRVAHMTNSNGLTALWHRDRCGMTEFGSGTTGTISMLIVAIEKPFVTVTKKLGGLPQVFALSTGLGGFITVMTLVFTTIFVKKLPYGDISLEYDARTLRGFQQTEPPRAELEQREPQSQTIGLVQSPIYPAHPPGIAIPADSAKQSE